MVDSHPRLGKDIADISNAAGVVRVDLVFLDLRAKVDPVTGRKLELHPKIFAELKRFILVSGLVHLMKA